MTTYVGTPFELATIGGATAYGAIMTKYAGYNWKVHDFGPGGGMGAPGIKPAKLKKWPLLTLSGKLCTGITSGVIAACGLSAPNFSVSRAPLAGVACSYGSASSGFTTSGCVGARLTISGTSNDLVNFSLDMYGKSTTVGAVAGGGGGADADFFPFELGSYGADLLGFTYTFNNGVVPIFGMDTQGADGWVNQGDIGSTCSLQLMLASASAAIAAAEAVSVGNAESITLASPGGGSLGISVTGWYSAIDRAEVAGVLCYSVTLSGFGASMTALS